MYQKILKQVQFIQHMSRLLRFTGSAMVYAGTGHGLDYDARWLILRVISAMGLDEQTRTECDSLELNMFSPTQKGEVIAAAKIALYDFKQITPEIDHYLSDGQLRQSVRGGYWHFNDLTRERITADGITENLPFEFKEFEEFFASRREKNIKIT